MSHPLLGQMIYVLPELGVSGAFRISDISTVTDVRIDVVVVFERGRNMHPTDKVLRISFSDTEFTKDDIEQAVYALLQKPKQK